MARPAPSYIPSDDPAAHAERLALHRAKVADVAAALRARAASPDAGRPLSLRKKGPSHQVPKAGDAKYRDDKIDVRALDRILAIDVMAMTCTAEPGVTFEALVRATLPLGLAPIV